MIRPVGIGVALAASLAVVALFATGDPARAASGSSPSDPRATFTAGNVTRCGNVGLGSDVQVGTTGSATGPRGVATVQTNTGPIRPGKGEELNITVNPSVAIVVDAVIVKGGNGYNTYKDPAVLPPTLPSPQHYIAPLTVGGNVPDISHWIVCLHAVVPPPSATLRVLKVVIPPASGVPVTPLPATYSAQVDCDDGVLAHQNVPVSFASSGGDAVQEPAVTGLAPGTTCKVVENNPTAAGGIAAYEPATAATSGITVPTNDAAITATIVDDFTHVPVQPGDVDVVEHVDAPAGVEPPTVTVDVTCDDGTNKTVTLPATSTPDVPVQVRAECTVTETTPLPPGWDVIYAVDGTSTSKPPSFVAHTATRVTVTLLDTNTTTTTTATPAVAGTSGPTLARTGISTQLFFLGAAFIVAGIATLSARSRRRMQ
jgi:hypothetical protein